MTIDSGISPYLDNESDAKGRQPKRSNILTNMTPKEIRKQLTDCGCEHVIQIYTNKHDKNYHFIRCTSIAHALLAAKVGIGGVECRWNLSSALFYI